MKEQNKDAILLWIAVSCIVIAFLFLAWSSPANLQGGDIAKALADSTN